MLTGKFYITNACAFAGLIENPSRDDSYEYYKNERKKITPKAPVLLFWQL